MIKGWRRPEVGNCAVPRFWQAAGEIKTVHEYHGVLVL